MSPARSSLISTRGTEVSPIERNKQPSSTFHEISLDGGAIGDNQSYEDELRDCESKQDFFLNTRWNSGTEFPVLCSRYLPSFRSIKVNLIAETCRLA
jgi:hypothetical protein